MYILCRCYIIMYCYILYYILCTSWFNFEQVNSTNDIKELSSYRKQLYYINTEKSTYNFNLK